MRVTDPTLLWLQDGVVFCDHINIVSQTVVSDLPGTVGHPVVHDVHDQPLEHMDAADS